MYILPTMFARHWRICGYKTKGAIFDKVKPKGAMGAWELVARYEEIGVDYDVRIGDADGRADYDAEKMVLGLNWYANNNIKFMLNYLETESDMSDLDGDAIPPRTQYAF